MAARRVKALRQGTAGQTDGIVWHREHRSKKNRTTAKWSGAVLKQKTLEENKKARRKKII